AWLRRDHLRIVEHGAPLVGTVLAAERTGDHRGKPIVTLELSVPRANGSTVRTTIRALFESPDDPLLRPGCRVYLRADPKDSSHVVLARNPMAMRRYHV